MTPGAAVIVTTSADARALGLVLAGLSVQSRRDFEAIVAENGADAATAGVVGRWAGGIGRRLAHVRQEDRGFRAAALRNLGIVASAAPYVVFLDGDCVPSPRFVEDHLALSERGWFVQGHRVLVGSAQAAALSPEGVAAGRLPGPFGVGNPQNLLRLSWRWLDVLRRGRRPSLRGIRTANMGVWRDDLLAVGGFDEAYEGWGREDADLAARLFHLGVRRKEGRFAAAVLHLHHPERPRDSLSANDARLAACLRERRVRAVRGLS